MQNIVNSYKKYHPEPDISKLYKAYEMAELAYQGEYRLNGEPWIAYAKKLTEATVANKLDTDTICAALLIDAYRFGFTKKEIDHELGGDVSSILDSIESLRGLSSKYNIDLLDANYANYLRQVILTTGQDIRVIALRMFQKLVLLDALEPLDPQRRRAYIRKTLEIYSPLASILGLNKVSREMAQKAFKIGYPEEWFFCDNLINKYKEADGNFVSNFISNLKELFEHQAVPLTELTGREKEHFSLFKKSLHYADKYHWSFETAANNVQDKWAFRIITPSVEDCYSVLSILHKNFTFLPDAFDDYIARPKSNGYQSLQTIIKADHDLFCEIQIRTPEMHEHNEYGPASHVYYKMYGSSVKLPLNKLDMLKELLLWKSELFSKTPNLNLSELENEILVFTPKGLVISLPKDATPIDFAYAVHSDLGNKAVMCKVNGKLEPLIHTLSSGDVVEIIISNNRPGPNVDWLNTVKSPKARISIKKQLAKTK